MLIPKRLLRSTILCCLLGAPWQAHAESFQIRDIRVEGLQRISAGTVFNYLPVKIGESVDMARGAEIIRALFATGFFNDVRLEREGDVLVVFVAERPSIAEITISGNKAIESDALLKSLKDIGLAEGRVFNRSVLDKIEQELKRQYYNQGKYAVELKSEVTPLERNRVAVSIDITEGETARIRRINLIGNKAFEEEELLDELELGLPAWYGWFSKRDQYSKQKLGADLEILKSFYLDRGYVNFRVDSTQVSITPDKKDIYVTINLTEGEVYTLSDIKLAGDLVVPKEELFPLIHLTRNEVFSRKQVTGSADRISKFLGDKGYAFANVNSIPEINEAEHKVAITFFVDPGKRAYVRRINIKGNSTSRDEVLRREMRQMESAWFSTGKVERSRERLQRLGYFDEVNIETPAVPGSTDQVDVNVAVKEKPAGNLMAGVGFSQSEGIIFNTSVTQNNFLGTGKQVTLAFNNSDVNTQYRVAYTNPYYTVDGISRGFDLYFRSTDYEEEDLAAYTTDVGGAGINFGIPINDYDRVAFDLYATQTDFQPGAYASKEILSFVKQNGDSFLDFPASVTWSHDSRDSAIFPTKGGLQSVYGKMTVPGSDLTYYKVNAKARQYIPLSEDFTLSLNADLGYGDGYGDLNALPFFENFFAGGVKSVRGFQSSSLGPRDSNGDPLGGNLRVVGNAELFFPPPLDIAPKSLRMGVFFDVGGVYDTHGAGYTSSDLKYSTGVSMLWLSPIGALGISVAQPFNVDPIDDEEQFQFTFGSSF